VLRTESSSSHRSDRRPAGRSRSAPVPNAASERYIWGPGRPGRASKTTTWPNLFAIVTRLTLAGPQEVTPLGQLVTGGDERLERARWVPPWRQRATTLTGRAGRGLHLSQRQSASIARHGIYRLAESIGRDVYLCSRSPGAHMDHSGARTRTLARSGAQQAVSSAQFTE
jgi:hypothetical protein